MLEFYENNRVIENEIHTTEESLTPQAGFKYHIGLISLYNNLSVFPHKGRWVPSIKC